MGRIRKRIMWVCPIFYTWEAKSIVSQNCHEVMRLTESQFMYFRISKEQIDSLLRMICVIMIVQVLTLICFYFCNQVIGEMLNRQALSDPERIQKLCES